MNGTMTRNQTLRLTMTGMFMAMTVILSLSIFSIPVPGGHLYFCDTVINVAAIRLDPVSAFVVGGIGSFLGDFFFYPAPMFVSLVTHGLQAVVVSLISHRILKRRQATANARVNRPSNILQKYYQKDFSPLMSKKDIEVKRDERIL